MIKLLYFDLETTGLDSKLHAIHQLAGTVVIDGQVKEHFDIKMKPFDGALVEKEALEVGGKTVEQIMAYQSQEAAYREFLGILGRYVQKFDKKDKFFIVGFNNASFDNPFLREFFLRNNDKYFGSWFWSNTLDVMVFATVKLLNVRHEMENFKLKTVAATLGIEIDETKLHEGSYDIFLTREILVRSLQK